MLNPFLVAAMRMGISVWGSRVLEVRGRTTGEPRRTPVNLLTYEGREYLVSPRGDSQWARNVRADNGRLVLELGRRRDERTARELPDDEGPWCFAPTCGGGRWRSACSSGRRRSRFVRRGAIAYRPQTPRVRPLRKAELTWRARTAALTFWRRAVPRRRSHPLRQIGRETVRVCYRARSSGRLVPVPQTSGDRDCCR